MGNNKKAEVKRIIGGFLETNMYLFEEEDHLLIIDPNDSVEVLKAYRGAISFTVLLTHEHFDHIFGLNRLRDSCNVHFYDKATCTVIASALCSKRIQDEKVNLSAYADVIAVLGEKRIPESWEPFACAAADVIFSNRYSFHWMGHSVDLFYTPGHSVGSCCILLDDMFFVGDTILENKLMLKFPGSNKKLYRKITIPLLEKLLVRAKYVYPGHGDIMTPNVALSII